MSATPIAQQVTALRGQAELTRSEPADILAAVDAAAGRVRA